MPLTLEERVEDLERQAKDHGQKLDQLLMINEKQSKTLSEILVAWNGATFTISLLKGLAAVIVFGISIWGATKIGK